MSLLRRLHKLMRIVNMSIYFKSESYERFERRPEK